MQPQNDIELVRSEERLYVSTQDVPVERVRLVKHVVTEQRTIEVRREELRVEHEPIADDEHVELSALRDSAEPLEIVLHEEEVVLRAVPRERVRVHVERGETSSAEITDTLRREEIRLDSPEST